MSGSTNNAEAGTGRRGRDVIDPRARQPIGLQVRAAKGRLALVVIALPATALSNHEKTGRVETSRFVREKNVQVGIGPFVHARIDPAVIVRFVRVRIAQAVTGRSARATIDRGGIDPSVLAKTGRAATGRFVHARTAAPIVRRVIGRFARERTAAPIVRERTAGAIARRDLRGRNRAVSFAAVLENRYPAASQAASQAEETSAVAATSVVAVSPRVEIAAAESRLAATVAAEDADRDDRPHRSIRTARRVR
jgi:hypothetical protein